MGINTKRDSNFELLRIIAMFMIVVWHLCVHGIQNYIDVTDLNQMNQFLFFLIKSVTVIAVNLYVFISGYFLYNKNNFKPQKVFKLILEPLTFSMVIYSVLLIIEKVDFSISFSILSIFPIFFGQYWFITVYLIMFLLSPYLNIVIKNTSKKQHLHLVMIMFFIDCVWQFIYVLDQIGVYGGSSVFHFVFLYFVAAFLGKYGFIIKDFNKYVYLSGFLFLTLVNTIGAYITSGSIDRLFGYNSPVVFISTFCLFMFFKKISFQSSMINFISKYTLGVYLIHEHFLIRPLLWGDIGVVEKVLNGSEHFFAIKIIVLSILIFGVCWILGYIISIIFSLIFNKLSSILNRKKSSDKVSGDEKIVV